MIIWAEKGREILANNSEIPAQERELMEAKLRDVELTVLLLQPQAKTTPVENIVDSTIEAAGSTTIISKPSLAEHLKTVIAELKKGTRTQELFTDYWRDRLQVDGARVGLKFEVLDCNWTDQEVQKPMVDIYGKEIPGLIFPDLNEITLPILGQMYPRLGSSTVQEGSPVTETHNTRGWLKVYDSTDAPNRNSRRSDVERFAAKQGYLPGREKGYILSDLFMFDTRGQHVDSGPTWSWLLGARIKGKVVNANVNSNGNLNANWSLNGPEIPNQNNGFRLEEARKA